MTQTHVFRFYGHKNEKGVWNFSEGDMHQAVHVVRLEIGDVFELTDFRGAIAKCKVTFKQKQKLSFEVLAETLVENYSTEDPPFLVLAQSKPGYFIDCLPILNELGFSKIAIYFQKSFPFKQKNSFKEKIQKILIESSKQCKRDFLLEILIFESLEECLDSSLFNSRQGWVWLPDSADRLEDLRKSISKQADFVLIGSELGFDKEELNILGTRSNLSFTKVGSLVMRSFTATLLAASLQILSKNSSSSSVH